MLANCGSSQAFIPVTSTHLLVIYLQYRLVCAAWPRRRSYIFSGFFSSSVLAHHSMFVYQVEPSTQKWIKTGRWSQSWRSKATIILQSVCCDGLKGRRWIQGSFGCAATELHKKTSQFKNFTRYNSSDNVWTLKLPLAFIDAVPLKYSLHSSWNFAFRSTLVLWSKHFDIWCAGASLSLYECIYF